MFRVRIRGLTLAEMLIATSVLGLLSAVCLSIYSMGIRAWLKADSRTEVMSILQTAQDRIATEVRSSQFPSVSTMPDKSGVAFLSAGEEWSRQVDPGGRLQWTNFVYFYSLPSDEHLYRTEVGYAPADPTLLSTLEAYSGSPLSSHKVGGQAISRNLNKFEAELQSPDLLRVILRAKVEKEEMELESCYRLTPQP